MITPTINRLPNGKYSKPVWVSLILHEEACLSFLSGKNKQLYPKVLKELCVRFLRNRVPLEWVKSPDLREYCTNRRKYGNIVYRKMTTISYKLLQELKENISAVAPDGEANPYTIFSWTLAWYSQLYASYDKSPLLLAERDVSLAELQTFSQQMIHQLDLPADTPWERVQILTDPYSCTYVLSLQSDLSWAYMRLNEGLKCFRKGLANSGNPLLDPLLNNAIGSERNYLELRSAPTQFGSVIKFSGADFDKSQIIPFIL